MSNLSHTAGARVVAVEKSLVEWIKHHTTVYHLTIAAVLGALTAGFVAMIAVVIIIGTNFNVLGWME